MDHGAPPKRTARQCWYEFLSQQPATPSSKNPVRKKDPSFVPSPYPRPFTARKYFSAARREVGSTMGISAAGITAFFLLLFFILAETCFMHTTLKPSPLAFYASSNHLIFRNKPNLSPIEHQLHATHNVPIRYTSILSPSHQAALLNLLSRPPSNSSLSPPTRKAVFTYISGCNIQQCLRALASSIAYARATGRVSFAFLDCSNAESVTQVLRLRSGGVINKDAMLLSIQPHDNTIRSFDSAGLPDWAEFGIIDAVVPTAALGRFSTHNSDLQANVNNPSTHDSDITDLDEDQNTDGTSTVGNTKSTATLDNLAAVDVHVSLSLSEVVWSKYAPRAAQERILLEELQANDAAFQDVIHSAAILGRRRETRIAENAEQELRNTFKIPTLLLQGMSPFARRLLLLKLMSKRRNGVQNPRAFFVHAQYGLGNRLRALGSAMAFSRATNRVLVLIWVADQHLSCRYTDLFVQSDEFVVSDTFFDKEPWPFNKTAQTDTAMKSVKWYNYMRMNGLPANSASEQVVDDKLHHIYVSTCYVIQSAVTPFIIRAQSSYWQVLRTLTPHIDVVRLTERFATYPMSSMIGIHIRGRSIKSDIHGVTSADYSEESSRRTDYWRNLTQVDTFIAEMRKQPSEQLFYVAADQKEVLARLDKEFPSRVFFTPRNCDSRTKDCLPFALADILLLAKCSSLRGSYWSSFSELSVRIGGARFLLAGVDFGRPDP